MAKQEILSLVSSNNCSLDDNLLIIDISGQTARFLAKRLALTRKIFLLLFSCSRGDLLENLEKYNWARVYNRSFCLRIEGADRRKEAELAGYIWRKVKDPKVDLENPKTAIHLFFINRKVYCCLLKHEIKHDYLYRKAHKRPEHHPTSLHPRLARALINLAGIKKGEIADLFCGSGGILIEAGLMGLNPIGYDIDQIMLNRAKINMKYYGIKSYKLIREDVLNLKRKIDYIVSDMPYGKNTKQKDIKELYEMFLFNLGKILRKRAVIVFPKFNGKNINYERLIRSNGLRIINKFEHYIHSSLTKKIFVLESMQ